MGCIYFKFLLCSQGFHQALKEKSHLDETEVWVK